MDGLEVLSYMWFLGDVRLEYARSTTYVVCNIILRRVFQLNIHSIRSPVSSATCWGLGALDVEYKFEW